ncbi:hypothetical protein [Silvibacterium dinghuense]|uniref:Uncharacterized protein n=1 Tax=Silvibacterium dinghuense TaxID=1560006 RepID=A0A4Q1SB93_9BACT|nr:hypothetical protein [Silvibacterium dinghuense]RXS94401.1 hypothetical protein ESZ00_15095 [Silvibacterium dinghuense]GGH16356.1 hypothetical protein GCM10011586_38120 [Silvibacterium dinghuense]
MALKMGAEDRKKVFIAGGLGLVVLVLAVRMILQTFVGGSTPAPAPAPAAGTSAPAAAGTGRASGEHEATKLSSPLAKLDPTLHPEWMAAAESLEYAGKGRNIFSMNAEPPAIEAVKAPIRPVAAMVPTGPPPPPPIDLKFFGYEESKSGKRRAFLLHGDDVFIALEGDVVDHRYKVLSILPTSLRVEDIPYSNTQSLPRIQN